MDQQQLNLFDKAPMRPLQEFKVGQPVTIVNEADKEDVENYHYLKEFVDILGYVKEILKPGVYEVAFSKELKGIFLVDELRGAQ